MRSFRRFRHIFGFSSCLLQGAETSCQSQTGIHCRWLNLWSHTGVAIWFERNLQEYMVAKETLYIWNPYPEDKYPRILEGLFGDDLWTWFTIYCWLQPRCWTLIGCGVICSFGKRSTSAPSSQNFHICLLLSKSPSQKFAEKSDLEENCGKTGESDLL